MTKLSCLLNVRMQEIYSASTTNLELYLFILSRVTVGALEAGDIAEV